MQTTTTKKSANSRESAELRINFIREKFPESATCNPYLDLKLINKIKTAMFDHGLYNSDDKCISVRSDTAIINYFRKIQSKPILKTTVESRKVKAPIVYSIY